MNKEELLGDDEGVSSVCAECGAAYEEKVRQLEYALREAERGDIDWRESSDGTGYPTLADYFCRRCFVPVGGLHRPGCLYEVLGKVGAG